MTENKYKSPQASKQLWHKSTLKSILFCGLIGFSLIVSNEAWGANAHQQQAGLNITTNGVLKELGFSDNFIAQLRPEDSISLVFKIADTGNSTEINISTRNPSKFPQEGITKTLQKQKIRIPSKPLMYNLCRKTMSGDTGHTLTNSIAELCRITQRCLSQSNLNGDNIRTAPQESLVRFRGLLERDLNKIVTKVDRGAFNIELDDRSTIRLSIDTDRIMIHLRSNNR